MFTYIEPPAEGASLNAIFPKSRVYELSYSTLIVSTLDWVNAFMPRVDSPVNVTQLSEIVAILNAI